MKPHHAYKAFRRKYRPLFLSAKRAMDSSAQRNVLDTVASIAFNAGYNARDPETPPAPIRQRPFTRSKK
jgi:hypothetical protein